MERDHNEDPGVDGMTILKRISEKWDGTWTGSIWLRIGTGGGLLGMRAMFWSADDLLASQKGLCSMELIQSVSRFTSPVRVLTLDVTSRDDCNIFWNRDPACIFCLISKSWSPLFSSTATWAVQTRTDAKPSFPPLLFPSPHILNTFTSSPLDSCTFCTTLPLPLLSQAHRALISGPQALLLFPHRADFSHAFFYPENGSSRCFRKAGRCLTTRSHTNITPIIKHATIKYTLYT